MTRYMYTNRVDTNIPVFYTDIITTGYNVSGVACWQYTGEKLTEHTLEFDICSGPGYLTPNSSRIHETFQWKVNRSYAPFLSSAQHVHMVNFTTHWFAHLIRMVPRWSQRLRHPVVQLHDTDSYKIAIKYIGKCFMGSNNKISTYQHMYTYTWTVCINTTFRSSLLQHWYAIWCC